MAQIVKLRRSSVPGQKPTNSNLQLGELALNTTDGKVYMAKSGSLGPSVEELISTNTVNTGSIHLVGDITASIFTGSFTGDGTNLYNIPASGVTGLNLTRIADGNATASISNSSGLKINTNTEITGSLIVSSGSAVFDASLQLTENSSLILNSGSNLYVYDGGIISGTFKGNGALLTDLPYATTASNQFFGNQTITGSVTITQNLTVLGSSSILYVTSSQLDIATNIIKVNAQNPGTRFGGLAVIDSGSSPQVSGSFLFDSIKDEWIFVHQAIVGSPTTSSVFLLGPETFNDLGNESYLTQNRIPKGSGIEHLNDSNITDTGTKVSINSNTEITGTFVATGTALVSGSSQINITGTDGYTTFSSSVKDRIDTVTGSITDLSSSVKDRIDIVTGSITDLSSSVKDRIDIVTGSITNLSSSVKDRIDTVTGSITDLSSSVKDRIDVVTGSITDLSSSVKNRIDVVTGSITDLSSSVKNRIDVVTGSVDSLNLFTSSYTTNSFTGSFKGDGSGLYNIPASGVTGLQLDKIINGNASASINNSGFYVNRDVFVDGTITAKEIHIDYVTSSVLYQSGSTKFGDSNDDTHQFTGSVKISGSLQSDSITGSFTGSFTGNASGLVNVPFHISGSDVNGGTYNKQFSKLQFDDSTGLNVSESVAGTAFISIGSHFRDIFVSGSDMLRATGSDAFEIIPEGGIEVTTSITDTNSNGYIKELRLSTTTLSSSLDTRIDNLSSSVVYQSETSSMTVLSSSYALTASFALNAGAGAEGRTYIHTQSSASTTWTVTHNLGEKYPAIIVFDSSDNVIVPGTITAINDNSFTVTFPSAQIGKVSATVGGGLPFVSASFVDYVLAVNNDIPYWKGGVISGSAQIIFTGTTGYSTFSSSIATTTLNTQNRVDSIEAKTGSYATTGSNLFIGTQTLSGSIIPSVDNLYDLGSSTHQWRDVYISSGSLYIDGTKVISSTTQELQITTDTGQSIKILEGGTDSIILQTADGDVELKSSGDGDILLDPTNGKIMLKGPVEILNGQKIQSSVGGTPVVFANDIVVSGSIELTGTIDGIDLTSFSSSANTRLTNLESSGGSLNSFTASANTRLGALETQSGSINSFTASANTRLGALETESGSIRFDLNSHISSANGRLISIETSTGSLNSFSSSTSTRLSSIEISTGSLNSFTSSTAGSLTAIQTSTSSLNSFTSSTEGSLIAIQTSTSSLNSFTASTSTRLGALETSTSSLNTFSSSTNGRLTSIETSTSSLNSFTSSTAGSLIAIQTSTASLNSFSSSTNTRVGALETESGSIRTAFNSYTSSNDSTNTTQNNRLISLETSTSSLNTFSSSTNTRVGALETESGSIRTAFNSYTSSNDGTNTTQNNRLTALETSTSSLNSFTSSTISKLTSIETSTGSLNTFSSSTNTRVGALETESGSIRTAFNSYTSSNDGTNTTQNGRLTSLEGKTGSYATTGSNVFIGNQTITGSLYISENLVVAGSSSISFISQSTLNIGTNLITVNAQNPGTRFGGLAVIDSGSSPLVSGSILFDSVNDQWIFVHQAIAGSPTTSSVVLMGPESFNSLGSEIYPTTNRIVKSINSEHLGDSNITDTGTKVSINSNTEITGTFVATGTALVSGSSQINHNTTTNYVANEHINHTSVSISAGNGLSGGGDISSTRTITLDTGSAHFTGGVKSKMNTDGVISGSSQITFLSINSIPSGLVSGSSQVLSGTGIWSGSAQLPSGVVSGSSQVLNGSGVWSGSAQLPSGVVSGSSQITYGSISSIPSGIVSGSSQISFGSISGLPSGLVSGSSQISFGSITGVPSGLVSGSSQITYGSLSGIPSGIVSGSSQITLSSTSGFGSYLNQAVLTTSTPTFDTLTLESTSDNKLNLKVKSGDSNDWNYINFYGVNGVRDCYFGTDSGGNPTWYRDDNGVYITLGSTATVNGTQIVTNSGTWSISISGNATTATTAGALSSMNISQFTNNSGYITGINSSAVTTALGYTPYNATNPNGYITGIAFSSVSSKPTTLSGYGITDSLYQDRATVDVNAFNSTGLYRGSTSGWSNRPTSVHNGGALLQIDTHPGNYHSQLFFDTGGNRLYLRSADAGSWGSWATIYHSGNLTNLNQLSNGPGYITGISFANVSSKPTTISGYGITDAITTGNIGSQSVSYATTAGSTTTLSSNAVTSGYLVIGGGYGSNAYNAVSSTRLFFGGGDSDAVSNYYIGTNLENVGGNYTKLDLRWHTGIRMGAQPGYGGIRFFDTEDLGTVLFSISNGDSNVRSHTNLIPSANNSYNLGSSSLGWANVYTNDLHLSNMNKPEGNDIDGTNGNWTIQEGAENLYIINNNNGKKFKISLEEI